MPIALAVRAAGRAALKLIQVAVAKLRAALTNVGKSLRRAEAAGKDFRRSTGSLRGGRALMPKIGFHIKGMKEFRRELRKLANPTVWTAALKDVNRAAAEEALREVQALARSQPRRRGSRPRPEREHWSDYVAGFRVVASQTSAGIRLGSTVRRKSWHLGSNFGGGSRYRQFPPPADPDYALYRGIERATPRVVEHYGKALDKLARKAFPD